MNSIIIVFILFRTHKAGRFKIKNKIINHKNMTGYELNVIFISRNGLRVKVTLLD